MYLLAICMSSLEKYLFFVWMVFLFLEIIALFEKLTSKLLLCVLKSHKEHPRKKIYSFHRNKDKKMGLMTAPNDISQRKKSVIFNFFFFFEAG